MWPDSNSVLVTTKQTVTCRATSFSSGVFAEAEWSSDSPPGRRTESAAPLRASTLARNGVFSCAVVSLLCFATWWSEVLARHHVALSQPALRKLHLNKQAIGHNRYSLVVARPTTSRLTPWHVVCILAAPAESAFVPTYAECLSVRF
jgi:hypothetical protein